MENRFSVKKKKKTLEIASLRSPCMEFLSNGALTNKNSENKHCADRLVSRGNTSIINCIGPRIEPWGTPHEWGVKKKIPPIQQRKTLESAARTHSSVCSSLIPSQFSSRIIRITSSNVSALCLYDHVNHFPAIHLHFSNYD